MATGSGPDGSPADFGGALSGAGDLNRDPFPELVVGAYLAMTSRGRASIFAGRAAGLAPATTTTLTGTESGVRFALTLAGTQ